MKEQKAGGEIRKMVAMDGHQGPKEINVQPEFLAWLTDPVKNGAGALFDFGCYGANLMTWLMDNQRPSKVTALAQTNKPQIYAQWTTKRPFCWIPEGTGHHPGVVELAVQPQGFRSLRRASVRDRDRRQQAAGAMPGSRQEETRTPADCRPTSAIPSLT